MPKAILQFNLPEEQSEFETAQNGGKYSSVIWEVDQFLRSKLKYGEISEEVRVALQETRDKLWEQMNEQGIDL